MPIYEYACQQCNHKLSELQKVADAPLVDCPSCGEPGLKRLLSAPRFRLKGQGWYETDFKKDNQRNLAGEKEPAKANGDSGESAAGKDAKKETKTDAKEPAASNGKTTKA